MKHGVLDEASLHVMHGLRHGRWPFMDVMDYVMYRKIMDFRYSTTV